jgi:hypothetical protein
VRLEADGAILDDWSAIYSEPTHVGVPSCYPPKYDNFRLRRFSGGTASGIRAGCSEL